jgi:signal transduction histidine kinase
MFTRLKKRILLLGISLASTIIAASFIAIYLIIGADISRSSVAALERICLIGAAAFAGGDLRREAMSGPPWLKIAVDREWRITRMSSMRPLDEGVCVEFAEAARNDAAAGHAIIKAAGAYWRYKSESLEGSGLTEITAVDVTDNALFLRRLLALFVLVYIAALAIICWACGEFARRAVAPLARAWERHSQFIEDASHELKTPLSVMYANYDVIAGNLSETVGEQLQWLEYMKTGMDRMSSLIKDMLDLARSDRGDVSPSFAPIDAGREILDIVRAMKPKADEKSLNVSCSVEPGVDIVSDAKMFRSVFMIVYDNALKYADTGGLVEVRAKRLKSRAICSVANTLEPGAKPDLSRIFDRFYRADASRAEDMPGYGLGLPIARSAVKALGGKIAASFPNERSISFTFTLKDFGS